MIFLADENFPLLSIKKLRNSGFNVVSVIEESPGAKDLDILLRAHDEDCVLLTFDRDYGELIYKYNVAIPAGIIYFRFAPAFPEEPGEILMKIIGNKEVTIYKKFTVVERGRIRQRSL